MFFLFGNSAQLCLAVGHQGRSHPLTTRLCATCTFLAQKFISAIVITCVAYSLIPKCIMYMSCMQKRPTSVKISFEGIFVTATLIITKERTFQFVNAWPHLSPSRFLNQLESTVLLAVESLPAPRAFHGFSKLDNSVPGVIAVGGLPSLALL